MVTWEGEHVRVSPKTCSCCSAESVRLQESLSETFDGRGKLHCRMKEQIILSEIDYDKNDKHKRNVHYYLLNARTDEEGYELLKLMGMPFKS
jgi:ribosomal protein L5